MLKWVIVRRILEEIYWAALSAVDPRKTVSSHADRIRDKYVRGGFKQITPIAFGKAACLMVQGLSDSLGDLISSGIVVTKYGHRLSTGIPPHLKVFEAGHPLPDENSLAAARAVVELAEKQGRDSLIVCLVSGGGSSLLALPVEGITLEEKQRLVSLLLKAGAGIDELNCVRKHLSRVKGGRLAEMAHPAALVSLIISDVIGDKLEVIASGPTAPDAGTYRDAYDVLEKYALTDLVPKSVLQVLRGGIQGMLRETPKEADPIFDNVENRIIANNKAALAAAAEKARKLGFQAHVLTSDLRGEANEAGRQLARTVLAQDMPGPACFLSGGETTVRVHGQGMGGRNMELALGFALEISGTPGIYLLSAGTDGDDNSTGSAGAIVDGSTVGRARALGLDPRRFLENNDSHMFFKELGDLFVTGPTGTNVMDIQIVLLAR